jgi:hypothetical protein
MWISDKSADKSTKHVCKGKTLADMDKKNIEIRNHQGDVFSWIYEDGDCLQERISFCPYCGSELESEETENDGEN